MDSPALLVIPPTPIRDTSSPSPQPSPVPSTTTQSSSIPELAPSSIDRERSSSETTIVTIYSMYGEDEDERRSWSATAESMSGSDSGHMRHRSPQPPSKDVNILPFEASRISDFRPDSSYLSSNGNKAIVEVVEGDGDGGSIYYDATYGELRPASKRYSTVLDLKNMRHSVLSDADGESTQLAYTDSRPPSSYVRASTLTRATSDFDGADIQRRSSPFPSDRKHLTTSHSAPSSRSASRHSSRPVSQIGTPETVLPRRSLAPSPESIPPPRSRPPSRPTSHYRQSSSSHYANGNGNGTHSPSRSSSHSLKGLPPLPSPSPPVASSSSLTTQLAPPVAGVAPSSLEIPTPATPPTAAPELRSPNLSTPGSKHSLVPSEGEDPDAFHVRSTYAHLDTSGVRGDGYVEGVERTRAKVGSSRASEMRALEALADEHEKTRELTGEETQMLGSLDRYGFYVIPSHDRLIKLPAAPLLKPFSRVTSATTTTEASPPLLRSQPPVHPPAKEGKRIAKWSRMLQVQSRDQGGNIEEWGIKASKKGKVAERTFKGIPDCWRSAAWELLMSRRSKNGKQSLRRLAEQYRECLDKPSTYDVQIDLDVPRTITGHIMFKTRYGQGQRSLFHVLHSLSLHCEDCGYCQGMGPIAATLLCYFDPERVYASLVHLHDSYGMHSIFSPGFPGLLEAIYVQERMTEQMMPAVYAAFKKNMISTTSYATKWYITLFANSVPFQMQLRLWDAFLLEGPDIFVVTAIAVVWVYRDHITSESANFETVLSLLSSFFVPEDEDALLSWIQKVTADKKLRSQMRAWRAEWNQLVASGKHNDALL